MSDVLAAVAAALLVVGTGFTFVAAIGLFRMPDSYARLHVATKPATLGVAMTFTAAMLQVPLGALTTRLAVAVLFQFWTIPAANHLLGRAARRAGVPASTRTVGDDSDPPPT